MMKENKNDKYKLIMVWFGAFFIMILIMIFSFRSKAASDQDYFPMEQNKNGNIPDNILTYISNNFNTDYYYICYYEKKEQNDFRPGTYYYYFRLIGYNKNHGENPLFCEINNDLIHFSVYANTQNGLLFRRLSFYDGTPNNITVANNGDLSNFQNLISSNYNTSKDYVSNFTVYTSNNTSSRKIVLLSDGDIYIPEGDTAPENMERPEIEDYIPDWTNRPTFDNSSVENALQSVFNGFLWVGDNIKGTISGTGQFIGDTVRWGLQRVIDTIRSKIDDLKSSINGFLFSINGFLSDIKDKISDFYNGFIEFADLFIHPFDEEEFEEQIENCQLISQYEELLDNCDIIREVFATAQEEDSFILYISFENPLADTEHKIISGEINFNWLVPLRTVYRPFLWVFTLLECFIGGFSLLGNIIGGKAK